MTRVKICGITNLDDALAAVEAGADALGFVLAEEARGRNRYISLDDAADIIEQLPPFVTTVAVTVNDPMERLVKYLNFFDCVQLHGDEQPGHLPMGHLAIKAFRVGPGFNVSSMMDHQVRAWLLDAYVPGQQGGTGQTFDWDVAQMAVSLGKPVILAGGLSPENVGEAVFRVRPFAVDVSGGVEKEPGKKDHDRIREFIDIVRATPVA
jgi:phosphoribosylanthranilate isomerase